MTNYIYKNNPKAKQLTVKVKEKNRLSIYQVSTCSCGSGEPWFLCENRKCRYKNYQPYTKGEDM